MSRELRERLDEITDSIERYPLETHSNLLEELALGMPHSILVLQSPEPLGKYNCVMHALGLVGRMTEYSFPLLAAKPAFVSYLIKEKVLLECEARPDAVATWSTPDGLKHAGRLMSVDRAESKWGLGHLCQHGLDELPIRYGNRSAFYASLGTETVLEHLEVWCTRTPTSWP